ncbi:MAG: peptidoglycan DD-metalloendopeptidase family protein [Actinobacteria bacterium]|nr:peptidoglycan DD-metalloendopeptidase family protein [Actinomycetota bacterium]
MRSVFSVFLVSVMIGASVHTAAAAVGPSTQSVEESVSVDARVVELPDAGLVASPLRVDTTDKHDVQSVDAKILSTLVDSPVPPLVPPLDKVVSFDSVGSGMEGYAIQVTTDIGMFGVYSVLAPLITDAPSERTSVSYVINDRVGTRGVFIEAVDSSGGDYVGPEEDTKAPPPGFEARWYQHGVKYEAWIDCSAAPESGESDSGSGYVTEAQCLESFKLLLASLRAAPAGNTDGSPLSAAQLAWVQELYVEEQAALAGVDPSGLETNTFNASTSSDWVVNGSTLLYRPGQSQASEVSHNTSNSCNLITSSVRPGMSYYPAGCLRLSPTSTDNWDDCPGGNPGTLASCTPSGKTGIGNTTSGYITYGMVFPLSPNYNGNSGYNSNVHSYANSVIFGAGGHSGAPAGHTSLSDPMNWSMPWEDNYGEWRPSTHKGQDIRPPTNEKAKYFGLAPTGGTVTWTRVGSNAPNWVSSAVKIVRGNTEYLSLHMSSISVSVGNRVERGERIGRIDGIGTGPYHLHFQIKYNNVQKNPYNSLVAAYKNKYTVEKSSWDNNVLGCSYGAYFDFDYARRVMDNTNSRCGNIKNRENGFITRSPSLPASTTSERVYLRAKCNSPNTNSGSFDNNASHNYVGSGYTNNTTRVYQVQYDMYKAGYTPSSNLDCYWGNVTKTAVKNFQSCNGLVSDGIVGRSTWGKMVDNNKNATECYGW